MRLLLVMLTSVLIGNAWAADNDAEFKRLSTMLAILSQEQTTLTQQIQLIQAMRQSNAQAMCNGQIMPPGTLDYSEWVAAQRDTAQREQKLRDQTDQLYDRLTELEQRKQPLLQHLYELAKEKAK